MAMACITPSKGSNFELKHTWSFLWKESPSSPLARLPCRPWRCHTLAHPNSVVVWEQGVIRFKPVFRLRKYDVKILFSANIHYRFSEQCWGHCCLYSKKKQLLIQHWRLRNKIKSSKNNRGPRIYRVQNRYNVFKSNSRAISEPSCRRYRRHSGR